MADNTPAKRLRAGDSDRDAVLEVLQTAYGNGRLTMDEYSSRQDAVLVARFHDELTPLVADLPEQARLAGAVAPRAAAPVEPTNGANTRLAVMSGTTVELEPGSEGLNSLAFWGGDDIYVTDAMGPGATITLNLHAIMGGNNVYVPAGVRVVDKSFAIMAGNEIKSAAQGDGSNGTVILQGFLWWAGNEVKLDKRQRSTASEQ